MPKAEPAHKVVAQLETLIKPLDDFTVTPPERNPRERKNLDDLVDSLKRHGQYAPIEAQASTGRIVSGNHLYMAMRELGWTHGAVTVIDCSDEDADRMMLVDNRTAEKGELNQSTLLTLLQEMEDLEGTGYDWDEVDDLAAALGDVMETEMEEFTGGYAETDAELAARTAETAPAEGATPVRMREVSMLLDEDEFIEFATWIKGLTDVYGTTGTVETIRQAVRDAYEHHVNAGDIQEG